MFAGTNGRFSYVWCRYVTLGNGIDVASLFSDKHVADVSSVARRGDR